MNDEELGSRWAALEPTMIERRRISARVFASVEAHDTPLAAEWFGLFKSAPFATLGLAAVSAVTIIAAPPILWLARALMSV